MVQPLKLMVPLLARLVTVQLPVRFHVQPLSTVITALPLTAEPPGFSGGVWPL